MSVVFRIKPKAVSRVLRHGIRRRWMDVATYDKLIDLSRNWKAYRNRFGRVDSKHWFRNIFIIYQITENKDYQLKIEVTGFEENGFAFSFLLNWIGG